MSKALAKKLYFVYADENMDSALAETALGSYEIFVGMGGSWCAEFRLGAYCRILTRRMDVSKDEAIEICQTDFNQRVQWCLEPPLVSSNAKVFFGLLFSFACGMAIGGFLDVMRFLHG